MLPPSSAHSPPPPFQISFILRPYNHFLKKSSNYSLLLFTISRRSGNITFYDHFFFFSFLFFFFSLHFLGQQLQHMEVLRLGVKSELQLLAYATATATPDPSHLYDLHHDSQQRWILNPLSKARDGTDVLMDVNQVHFC